MSKNRYLIPVVIIIVLILFVIVVFQPQVYFQTNAVDEAFPGLNDDEREAIRTMPEDQQTTLIEMASENPDMAEQTAKALMEAASVVPEADQAMPDNMPDEPVVLSVGSFITIDPVHGAEGSATIYELVDGSKVLRFEDFKSTNGPELHVILSKTVPTSTFGDIGDDYVDLGELKGNIGNQNYEIPDDVNIEDFASVVIYCVPFGVVFSSAALGS